MARLNINDLHYVVMEGGGARGNTHLGAIRALESQMKKRQENNPADISIADVDLSTRQNVHSIMDYLEDSPELGETVPVIRGVAGTSAGAIASFALALGLNSEEINTVMEFDFARFLSEDEVAIYRMIGEDSSLMVGEDSGLSSDIDPDGKVKKTLGGKRSKEFKYELGEERTKVKGNFWKKTKRGIVINFVLEGIFSGLYNQLGRVLGFLRRIGDEYRQARGIATAVENLFSFMGNAAGQIGLGVQRMVYNHYLRPFLFRRFEKLLHSPVELNTKTIGGLILDRGMFSGFQVREFFYDLLLYAATRDTLFQRSLIAAYDGKPIRVKDGFQTHNFTKDNLTYKDFEIGNRKETDFGKEATALFTHLQNLTFEEFFEIMGVDYTCSISNYTVDTTLYFSYRWTPQFRILEAVGGSMTIPPAVRPIYNASDVAFETGFEKPGEVKFPRPPRNQAISVMVDGSPEPFVDENGQFTQTDYQLYEHVVKAALQKHLEVQTENKTFISLNNGIETYSTLSDLRAIVIGDYPKVGRGKPVRVPLAQEAREVRVDGSVFRVSDELLRFYYNAQFKGMFIDGGYRNNIPINHYREFLGNLDNVLTIKLDRSFPADFMRSIHKEIHKFLQFEDQILDKLDGELQENFMNKGGQKVENALQDKADVELDAIYERLITFVKGRFQAYFNQQDAFITEDLGEFADNKRKRRKAYKADREVIVELLREWIEFYGKKNYVKPWAVSKNILVMAFEGYAYGMERGQVRYQTDHDNFIILYDFGVSTYDFNLKKVRTLARMAQERAEDDTNRYFNAA